MKRRCGFAANVAALLLATTALAGCGEDSGAAIDFPDADQPYDGPLFVDHGRYGAAGQVVDCRTQGPGGRVRDGVYRDGATSDNVTQALRTAGSEGLFLSLPRLPLEVAKTESDRVLLTYATSGVTTAALIFHDGPASEGAGGDGWYLETWATCDLSEFSEEVVAESYYGYQIWTDQHGVPAPTSKVVSLPGPEHCDWQAMTFLSLDDSQTYIRRPSAELQPLLSGEFVGSMALPADAVDTGYERDGNRLWVSMSGTQVFVGEPGNVEAWPRFNTGCA